MIMKFNVNGLKAAINKILKGEGAKVFPDAGAKAVEATSKVKFAKVLGAAMIAKEADSTPVIKDLIAMWAQALDKIYGASVYKIPGFGDIAKKVSDIMGRFIVPNAQDAIEQSRNHPQWYTNLDVHNAFNIPSAYAKNKMLNGTFGTPLIACHTVVINNNPDSAQVLQRTQQLYTMLKAVRGLSATSYNVNDVFNYRVWAIVPIIVYYRIKALIQAVKTYRINQPLLAQAYINALGFSYNDVSSNLANYETLLVQFWQFIHNNCPISGDFVNRVEYLCTANIADHGNSKLATYHMFNVEYNQAMYQPGSDATDNVLWPSVSSDNEGKTYGDLSTLLQIYSTHLAANSQWSDITSDYWGAFGTACSWSDKTISFDKENRLKSIPDLTFSEPKALELEQIKNASYLQHGFAMIEQIEGGDNDVTFSDTDSFDYKFVSTVDQDDNHSPYNFPANYGDLDGEYFIEGDTSNYDSQVFFTKYLAGYTVLERKAGAGSDVWTKFLMPDRDGFGAEVVTLTGDNDNYAYMFKDNRIEFTKHKDKYSEGEDLEIAQFKSFCIYENMHILEGNAFYEHWWRTGFTALKETKVYVWEDIDSNGSPEMTSFRVCSNVLFDGNLTNADPSDIRIPYEISLWTMIDWMPALHETTFTFDTGNLTYYPKDLILWDIDSFGTLDLDAFDTSIEYSIFSMYAPKIKIGNKRFDNISEVYNAR